MSTSSFFRLSCACVICGFSARPDLDDCPSVDEALVRRARSTLLNLRMMRKAATMTATSNTATPATRPAIAPLDKPPVACRVEATFRIGAAVGAELAEALVNPGAVEAARVGGELGMYAVVTTVTCVVVEDCESVATTEIVARKLEVVVG